MSANTILNQVALQKPKSFLPSRFLRPVILFKTKLYAETQQTSSKRIKNYDYVWIQVERNFENPIY